MSCHYSCSTCSVNYYFDNCLTCPATRTLVGSVCACNSNFYQFQSSQCLSDSQISAFDSSLLSIINIAYYVAIGFHILSLILLINRMYTIKMKKILDTFQITALIIYYRFLNNQVAFKSLKTMNAFNFDYFTGLICTYSGPPLLCNYYENGIGPLFTLCLFLLAFFISYLFALVIYSKDKDEKTIYIRKNRQQSSSQSLDFNIYWYSMYPSFFLIYLDQTIIQTTLSICRIIIVNSYAYLLAIPAILLLICLLRNHFKVINNKDQYSFTYRTKNSYFYLYDQMYHLNYIDYVFDKQLEDNKDKYIFYPQSNLMIMEILFKFSLATSTVIFYSYEPYMFAYCLALLLVIFIFIMKSFFYYQRSELLFYFFTLSIYIYSISTFWSDFLFTYFIFFATILLLILGFAYAFLIYFLWRKDKEGQMFKKAFQLEKQITNKIINNDSEDEFVKNNTTSPENSDIQIFQNQNTVKHKDENDLQEINKQKFNREDQPKNSQNNSLKSSTKNRIRSVRNFRNTSKQSNIKDSRLTLLKNQEESSHNGLNRKAKGSNLEEIQQKDQQKQQNIKQVTLFDQNL